MSDASPRLAWCLLAVLVIAGAAIRVHDLGHRPLGHVEAYTPGIEFPEGVSAPAPRLTLRAAVRGSLDEVHPPVWYAATWFWTRFAGTSLTAMRLPSAILGTLCILLVFLLGTATRDRWSGLVAAALVAGHGHHYFWSQMSRPSILGCVLSLTATLLLLRVIRGERPRPFAMIAFFAASLAGLGNSYYYWPVFGAQVLWIWGSLATLREQRTGLFRWCVVVLILATPIAGLAVYQSAGRVNYLETDAVAVFGELVGLCFPFHQVHDDPHTPRLPAIAIAALPLTFGALLLVGVFARKRAVGTVGRGVGSPSNVAIIAAALLAAGSLGAVAFALSGVERHADKALPIALIALAPILVGALLLVERRTGLLSVLPSRLFPTARAGVALVTVLAIVPPAISFGLNAVTPFLAPRHMLVFTPYLLVLVAIGLTTAIGRLRGPPRGIVAGLAALAVAIVLAASVEYDYHRSASATDYAGAAEAWLMDLEDDDVVFMPRHWVNTPILYYTRHLDRDYVWRDWGAALRGREQSRVWTVSYEGVPMRKGMREALAGHERSRSIERKNVTIELWEAR